MKLNSISIKNMHNIRGEKKIKFDDISYLYGRNGTGKSTILQAVQLALLGYIPGTNKKPADIFKHSNSPIMSICLELIDNNNNLISIRRTYRINSKGTVSSEMEIIPDYYDIDNLIGSGSLPIYNFSEFLDMSSNSMKDWFTKFLPEPKISIIWSDWFNNICNESKYDYTELIFDLIDRAEINSVNCFNDILNMHSIVKECITSNNAELKMIDSTLKSLIYYNDNEILSENIAELTLKRATLQEILTNLKKCEEDKQYNEYIYTKLSKLNLDADDIHDDKNYENLKFDLSNIDNKLSELLNKLSKIKSEIYALTNSKINLSENLILCPVLKEECSRLSEYKIKIESNNSEIDKQIKDLNKSLDNYETERINLLKLKQEIIKKIKSIEYSYDTKKHLTEMLKSIHEIDTTYTIDELNNEINLIDDKLIKLKANEKFNSLNESLTQNKFKLEHELDFLKICEKKLGVNGLQSEIMNAPIVEFSNKINRKLNSILNDPTISISFDMSNKSNSFSFGIINNTSDVYTSFNLLSSGEKAIYTFVMIQTIVEMNDGDLKLVLIDDLIDHLDDDASKKLFEYMSNISDMQIICAGVKPCNYEFKIEM